MFVKSLFKGKFADGVTILKNAKKKLTTKQSSKVQYNDVFARFTVCMHHTLRIFPPQIPNLYIVTQKVYIHSIICTSPISDLHNIIFPINRIQSILIFRKYKNN